MEKDRRNPNRRSYFRKRGLMAGHHVFKVIVICAVMSAALIGAWFRWKQQPAVPVTGKLPEKKASRSVITRKVPKVMDYGRLNNDPQFADMMQSRKEDYGIDKSLDMIVKSDENIKVGDVTVPMQEIADKIRLKEGISAEKEIAVKSEPAAQISPAVTAAEKKTSGETRRFPVNHFEMSIADGKKEDVYGVYVVQHADNVWNIHFSFLKEYFDKRKISVSPVSDEPNRGRSSGVGKLLKFSEQMVYIYNLEEHRLDMNLNLIHPLSKIVVFNLGKAFSLLEQIDYRNVNRIQFDGEKIRIPAVQ